MATHELTKRLTQLKQRGYKCEHPDFHHRPMKAGTNTGVAAVYLERDGDWPQIIFLDIAEWIVLIVGSQTDMVFDEFVDMLDGVEKETVRPLAGQRSLFD